MTVLDTTTAAPTWSPVCPVTALQPECGVAALIGDHQVAVFRTFDDAVYAVDNRDPFTGAHVLARGIVGTRGDRPTVASPLHKQVFDLTTGASLDDPAVSVAVFDVRIRDGVIEIGTR